MDRCPKAVVYTNMAYLLGFLCFSPRNPSLSLCLLSPLHTDLSPSPIPFRTTGEDNAKAAHLGGFCSFVRIGRIELPTRPWQGRVLPLNHIRVGWMIAHTAVDYPAFCARSEDKRASLLKLISLGFPPTIRISLGSARML